MAGKGEKHLIKPSFCSTCLLQDFSEPLLTSWTLSASKTRELFHHLYNPRGAAHIEYTPCEQSPSSCTAWPAWDPFPLTFKKSNAEASQSSEPALPHPVGRVQASCSWGQSGAQGRG